jgi:hypothetical protein
MGNSWWLSTLGQVKETFTTLRQVCLHLLLFGFSKMEKRDFAFKFYAWTAKQQERFAVLAG